jgi:hypothetical protein
MKINNLYMFLFGSVVNSVKHTSLQQSPPSPRLEIAQRNKISLLQLTVVSQKIFDTAFLLFMSFQKSLRGYECITTSLTKPVEYNPNLINIY